jgi:hypothetical protein
MRTHRIIGGVLCEVPEIVLKQESEKPGSAMPGWLKAAEVELQAAAKKRDDAKTPGTKKSEKAIGIHTPSTATTKKEG